MKHLYNFRLDTNLINKLDKLNGTRTGNVTTALQLYLQNDDQDIYNVYLIDLLKDQVQELRADKQYLQNQVNALMLVKMPLLQRIKIKLLEGNTKS